METYIVLFVGEMQYVALFSFPKHTHNKHNDNDYSNEIWIPHYLEKLEILK